MGLLLLVLTILILASITLFVGGYYLWYTKQSDSLTDGIMDFLNVILYKLTGNTEQFRTYFILADVDILELQKDCSSFLSNPCVEVSDSWNKSGIYQIRITGVRPRSMYSEASLRQMKKLACRTLQLFYRRVKGLNLSDDNCTLSYCNSTEFVFEIPLTYTAEKKMKRYLQEKARHISK